MTTTTDALLIAFIAVLAMAVAGGIACVAYLCLRRRRGLFAHDQEALDHIRSLTLMRNKTLPPIPISAKKAPLKTSESLVFEKFHALGLHEENAFGPDAYRLSVDLEKRPRNPSLRLDTSSYYSSPSSPFSYTYSLPRAVSRTSKYDSPSRAGYRDSAMFSIAGSHSIRDEDDRLPQWNSHRFSYDTAYIKDLRGRHLSVFTEKSVKENGEVDAKTIPPRTPATSNSAEFEKFLDQMTDRLLSLGIGHIDKESQQGNSPPARSSSISPRSPFSKSPRSPLQRNHGVRVCDIGVHLNPNPIAQGSPDSAITVKTHSSDATTIRIGPGSPSISSEVNSTTIAMISLPLSFSSLYNLTNSSLASIGSETAVDVQRSSSEGPFRFNLRDCSAAITAAEVGSSAQTGDSGTERRSKLQSLAASAIRVWSDQRRSREPPKK